METTKTTDEQLKEQGAKLVGPWAGGIANKTPEWMSKWCNILIFAFIAWTLFSPQLVEIPTDVREIITRYFGIIAGLLKLASKSFGFKLPDTQQ